MVATIWGLMGNTFFTVREPTYEPTLARESTAMTTPSLYVKARVVVPCICSESSSTGSLLSRLTGPFCSPFASSGAAYP